MSKLDDTKLSEKIAEYDGGDYFITAAIWRTFIDAAGGYCDTYEIGIRNKKDGKFLLLQNRWNHQSVQEVANAIAHLLSIKTECYTPEWCRLHFCGLD